MSAGQGPRVPHVKPSNPDPQGAEQPLLRRPKASVQIEANAQIGGAARVIEEQAESQKVTLSRPLIRPKRQFRAAGYCLGDASGRTLISRFWMPQCTFD